MEDFKHIVNKTLSKTSERTKSFFLKNRRIGYFHILYTPKRTSIFMLLSCLIFALIGTVMIMEYRSYNEVSFPYHKCKTEAPQVLSPVKDKDMPKSVVAWSWNGSVCKIRLKVTKKMDPPVFLYYGLTEFYQNHRKYVFSFDSKQLKGIYVSDAKKLESNCKPLSNTDDLKNYPDMDKVRVNGITYTIYENAQIYPCGLKANSMFSDEISDQLKCVDSDDKNDIGGDVCSNYRDEDGENMVFKFSEKNTAPSEKQNLYNDMNWRKHFKDQVEFARTIVPPPNWRIDREKWKDGYTFENSPKLREWERFRTWMNSAALPTFRKLWGANYTHPLFPGIWELTIEDKFSVDRFKGTKTITISTSTYLGTYNRYLLISYFTCSAILGISGFYIILNSLIHRRNHYDAEVVTDINEEDM